MSKKNTKTSKSAAAQKLAKTPEYRALFHAAGLRLTRQRLAIYRELSSRGDHPDVDHIYKAVRPIVPKISLFTVYRTMNVMEASGLICRVTTWKSHARYGTLMDAHAHFLCEKCGRIDNVDVGDAGPVCHQIEHTHGKVTRVDMIFHGEGKCCAPVMMDSPTPPPGT